MLWKNPQETIEETQDAEAVKNDIKKLNLTTLPNEILHNIFSYVPLKGSESIKIHKQKEAPAPVASVYNHSGSIHNTNVAPNITTGSMEPTLSTTGWSQQQVGSMPGNISLGKYPNITDDTSSLNIVNTNHNTNIASKIGGVDRNITTLAPNITIGSMDPTLSTTGWSHQQVGNISLGKYPNIIDLASSFDAFNIEPIGYMDPIIGDVEDTEGDIS